MQKNMLKTLCLLFFPGTEPNKKDEFSVFQIIIQPWSLSLRVISEAGTLFAYCEELTIFLNLSSDFCTEVTSVMLQFQMKQFFFCFSTTIFNNF